MMRRSIHTTLAISLFSFIGLVSCGGGEDDIDFEVIEPGDDTQVPDSREIFNSTHTIRFPEGYVGGISEDGVGNEVIFEKNKTDDKVYFNGGFCDQSSTCVGSEYNSSSLVVEGTELVPFINSDGEPDSLDNQLIVSNENEERIAYFFYTQECECTPRNSVGRLYLLDLSDSLFKWAGYVSFDTSNQDEVLGIVETIKREGPF